MTGGATSGEAGGGAGIRRASAASQPARAGARVAENPKNRDAISQPARAGVRATVIDAGVGNIGNLVRALRHLGAEVEITCDPATIRASRCLVLPGVGAFRPPREVLRGAPEEAVRAALDDGATLLGICIGYQLLFDSSEEFGTTDGLALLPGRVTELPGGVPLPHIGWNRVFAVENHPLLAGSTNDDHFYFVHSFAPEGVPEEAVLGRCRHGRSFPAIVGRGRVAGTQFHPEKSGAAGLRLLRNYLAWARDEASGTGGEASSSARRPAGAAGAGLRAGGEAAGQPGGERGGRSATASRD